jgi:TetR/AcrR family transcriptional regulator, transcriptional repressor for nem operon
MNKGQTTREFIIEKAASIFNKNGFAGASLSELMAATGLKKGGIYNHFKNKDEIMIEAFDFAIKKFNRQIYLAYKDEKTSLKKMQAIIEFYKTYPLNPVIEGGCPIVNTAVDSDNTHPALKSRVKEVLGKWIENMCFIIEKGIDAGEIKNNIDAHKSAVFLVTTMQGGVLIARSFEKISYMEIIVDQLDAYINGQLKK